MKLPDRRRAFLLGAIVLVMFPVGVATGEEPPGERSERMAEAERLLLGGESRRAAESYSALLAEDPEDVAAMEGRGRALLAAQLWREALAETARFSRRFPDSPALITLRGEALYRAGRFSEAGTVLGPLCDAEHAPARALMVLGRLREAQGKQAEAISLMRAAVGAAPGDREVLYWASSATETREAALELLRRYLELSDGDDPDRVESVRGSIEFYEMLREKPIWVTRSRPERLELPLEPIWDPGGGQMLGYVIRVSLGSKRKPVPLLLDSGSPGLFVIERIAKKRGFQRVAEKTTFGGGGDRRHRTQRGFFDTVSIGGLSFTAALATTSKTEMDATGRFHGLIGLSVFNGYRVTLDLKRKLLLLEPPSEPLQDARPYWTVMGQFLVEAQVSAEQSGLFLLDSGATRTLISSDWAERIPRAKLGPPVRIQGFGGGMQGARSLDGVEVLYQGASTRRAGLRAVDLSLRSRLAGVEIAGFLGLDFLDRSRLVIDTTRRTIRLKHPAKD